MEVSDAKPVTEQVRPLFVPAAPSPGRATAAIITALALAAIGAYALVRYAPAHPLLILAAIPIYVGAAAIAARGLKPVKPTLNPSNPQRSKRRARVTSPQCLSQYDAKRVAPLTLRPEQARAEARRISVTVNGVGDEKGGRVEWPGLAGKDSPASAKSIEGYWARIAKAPRQVVIEAPEELEGILNGKSLEELRTSGKKDWERQNYEIVIEGAVHSISNSFVIAYHKLCKVAEREPTLLFYMIRRAVPKHPDPEQLFLESTQVQQQRSNGDLINAAFAAYGHRGLVNLKVMNYGPWHLAPTKDRTAAIYTRSFTLAVQEFRNPEYLASHLFTATVEFNRQTGMTTYIINRPIKRDQPIQL